MLYPICQQKVETVPHMVWNYCAANVVQENLSVPTHKWSWFIEDINKLLGKLSSNLKRPKIEKVAIIMRLIQIRRNEYVFQNKLISSNRVVHIVMHDREEYQLVQQRGNGEPIFSEDPRSARSNSKWEAPKANTVKVNWDIAVRNKTHMLGIRVVLRDKCGAVLACLNSSKTFSSSLLYHNSRHCGEP